LARLEPGFVDVEITEMLGLPFRTSVEDMGMLPADQNSRASLTYQIPFTVCLDHGGNI